VLRERQLARHAAQRLTAQAQVLSTPDQQKKGERERAEILAARKERRAREKEQSRQGQTVRATQPRYRRRRTVEDTDPLDAQNAGLHDEELAMGHEEIHLNLGPEEQTQAPQTEMIAEKPER
jgi:hypothetical protein